MFERVHSLEQFSRIVVSYTWGLPLLVLLLGGGLYFILYSRFLPFRYFGHAVDVLRGKYDTKGEQGEISHFQALSGHLAATVGMGNISGVALAIVAGGPGAIFWMWVSAVFGVATKFFTCTLTLMYRGKDSIGQIQGGPMYVIREAMPKVWRPLASFFCVVGCFSATPIFQANQIVQITKGVLLRDLLGWQGGYDLIVSIGIGLVITAVTIMVIFGGIKRIGNVASRLVPTMVVTYVVSVCIIMVVNWVAVIPSFLLIFEDAFSANAVLGGAVGAVILEGVKRAAFSNEAGIGTAPLMHGAAKTNEPVREGLVAMLGPVVDTIIVCTMTGLCILSTGVWQEAGDNDGLKLTLGVFSEAIPIIGPYLLFFCVLIFAFTTVLGAAYYGKKCFSYLAGAKNDYLFNYWYVSIIVVGSIWSLSTVVNLILVLYALMSIPTMLSAIYLSPKVLAEAKRYFSNLR